MSKLDELKAQALELREQIWEIESAEKDKEHRRLIGKCFKVRNSYSCPKDNSERWWLYSKVISSIDGSLRAIQFQIDIHGKAELEPDAYFSNYDGQEEIKATVFQSELKKWMQYVQDCSFNNTPLEE